jgi:predicted Zn-dependent peptidase
MSVKAAQAGLAPSRQVLANGVTVIAKETRTTPAVTIYARLLAGSAYDPPARGGAAHFVSRTIDRGTERHTADQLA